MEMSGRLGIAVQRVPPAPLRWRLRNWLRPGYVGGLVAVGAARALSKLTGIPTLTSQVHAAVIRRDGHRINYGVLGRRVVTDAFVQFMVDQLQSETSEWGDFKYHDCGEGSTAENASDTAMETQYGGARATGSQTEGASANIYKSVGTISFTGTKAITEHGLFSQSTGTTLMDRTVFSTINVGNGDSIQFTYELTCNSGS
jgi:hypothetical protein